MISSTDWYNYLGQSQSQIMSKLYNTYVDYIGIDVKYLKIKEVNK